MNNFFKFTLPGWKLFLTYGIPMFILIAGYFILIFPTLGDQENTSLLFKIYGYQIFMTIGIYLLYFVIIKLVLNNISHREGKMDFQGKFGKFAWILIRDGVLSMATLGIYTFWMIENLLRYFMETTTFGNRNFEFHGKGGDLFKRFLIYFLPFTILFIIAYIMMIFSIIGIDKGLYGGWEIFARFGFMFVSYLLYMLGYVLFMYKAVEWAIDLDCDEFNISLVTDFWATFRFMLKQLGLCLITFGLFWPAAIANIIKYIINHLNISYEDREVWIKNEVDTTSSWGYIFGQYIICFLTLGIYAPWAFVSVFRWFTDSTEFEGFDIIEEPAAIMIEEGIEDSVLEVKDETAESGDSDEIL